MLQPFLLANNKYVFVDIETSEIRYSKNEFDSAGFFKEGYSIVSKNKKNYFLTENGSELKLTEEYNVLNDFNEGLAILRNFGVSFCINKSGYKIHKHYYSEIYFRSDGLIDIVDGWSGKSGLMDRSGNVILEPTQDYFVKFNNGFAIVEIGNKVNLIDTGGKVLGEFQEAQPFFEGIAIVKKNNEYKLMDKEGKIWGAFKFINKFYEKITGAVGLDEKCYIIDLKGNILHEVFCKKIFSFKSGFACVLLENDDYSFCDSTGKVFKLDLGEYTEFNNGYIVIKSIDIEKNKNLTKKIEYYQYWIIDKDLKKINNFIYENIEEFRFGYAAFRRDSIVGFLDTKFNERFTKYTIVGSFTTHIKRYTDFSELNLKKSAFACVSLGVSTSSNNYKGFWGMIDTNGNEVCPLIYDSCSIFNENYFIVELNGKKGILDTKGNVILNCEYEEIIEQWDGYFYVENEGNRFVTSLITGDLREPRSGFSYMGFRGYIVKENKIVSTNF